MSTVSLNDARNRASDKRLARQRAITCTQSALSSLLPHASQPGVQAAIETLARLRARLTKETK